MTYAPSPYAPQPVVRRPPLPLEMRRAARRAGGVGFVLITIGWALVAAAAATGIAWAIIAAAAQRSVDTQRGLDQVLGFFGLPVGVLVGILVLVGLLGAAIWIVGLFTSRGILRRSGHPHPWGVTWAGFGLALVASWIGQWISYAIGQVVTAITTIPFYSSDTASSNDYTGLIVGYAVGGGLWLLLSLAVAGIAGALLWWAMAAAMRPGPPVALTTAPPAPSYLAPSSPTGPPA